MSTSSASKASGSKETSVSDQLSTTWLRELEEKVHAAADRLRELKTENDRLRQQLAQLEERINKDQEALDAASGWQEERQEVQQRVETLAEHLSKLLED